MLLGGDRGPHRGTEDRGKGAITRTGYEPKGTLRAEEAHKDPEGRQGPGKKGADKAHDDGATTKSS